jgi:hypothetical protein
VGCAGGAVLVRGAGAVTAGVDGRSRPDKFGERCRNWLAAKPTTTPTSATAMNMGTVDARPERAGGGLATGGDGVVEGQTGEGVEVMPTQSVWETC